MSHFSININGIRNSAAELETISGELKQYSAEIEEVMNGLSGSLSVVAPSLEQIVANTNKHSITMHNHSEALGKVADAYEQADRNIASTFQRGSLVTAAMGQVTPLAASAMDPAMVAEYEQLAGSWESLGLDPQTILAMLAAAIAEPGLAGEALFLAMILLAIIKGGTEAMKYMPDESSDEASAGSQVDDSEDTVDEKGNQDADEEKNAFKDNDVQSLSNKSRSELQNELPEGWTYEEHNGRVHIKDENGNFRIRIDEPDAKTPYRHMHVYDENGNCLDRDGNIVGRKDPAAHIPYND